VRMEMAAGCASPVGIAVLVDVSTRTPLGPTCQSLW
jgi:hypothetical protein